MGTDKKDLTAMEIGQEFFGWSGDWDVLRVPGGWIFRKLYRSTSLVNWDVTAAAESSVFVPLTGKLPKKRSN